VDVVIPALKQPIFMEIKPSQFFDWISLLAYPNLFGIKGFVVVVVVVVVVVIIDNL
jgi:hypothetical protein